MKPEDQRIALAQWCGWRLRNASSMMPGTYYHIDKAVNAQPPDYLNDLNAMHEAEKGLKASCDPHQATEAMLYREHLRNIAGKGGAYTATAAQRAEALLRTVGLWRECDK